MTTCKLCDGEGLVDFSDEEWIAMYGVHMAEHQFDGKEPETMKTCPDCDGTGGVTDNDPHVVILGDEVCWS